MNENDKSLKILVAGDVNGKLTQLYARVETVMGKSGPFHMLLCVGSFFNDTDNPEWEEYLSGGKKAPLLTYVLGPNTQEQVKYFPEQDGCELCENIVYLGKSGVLTGSNGLRVAYLSGIEGKKSNQYQFNYQDISQVLTSVTSSLARGVDVLLTSQWPKDIENHAGKPDPPSSDHPSSTYLSYLAMQLKPRYHFCGLMGTYYERLPYRNHRVLVEPAQQITRFISLGGVGDTLRRKWLYAFTIQPMSGMSHSDVVKQPLDVTEIPYSASTFSLDPSKPKEEQPVALESSEKPKQYFYDMSSQPEPVAKKKKFDFQEEMNGQKKRSHPRPSGPCWFCLSGEEVEKHLVVSIGEQAYLALAKGGLTPDHLLILPIGHYQSTVELTEPVLEEIQRFKTALTKMFALQKKVPVFFERNYKSQHLQVQVVPVPAECSSKLKLLFEAQAEENSFSLDELPKFAELKQITKPGIPYFYVELPDDVKLFHRVRKNFPLQFGREVLAAAEALDVPDRIDWRQCKSSKEEETNMTLDFRQTFHDYDFTL